MAYVDETGRKYEVQYCVVLREGEDKGLEHYVWASKEEIEGVFNMPVINKEISGNTVYVGHISGCKGDEVYFNRKKIGSLEIRAKNEITANKCAAYFKLPLPFSNYEKN